MEKQLAELISKALSLKATDIHLRLTNNEVKVQFRLRQDMVDEDEVTCSVRLFRYIQYRANLDVSDVLKPQTGQFEMEIDNQRLALRFAILSSFNVVSGVLRILNADFDLSISDLSFDKRQTEKLKKILSRRNGLVLLSGPTGSGKTTTLYTLLNQVENRKIFTLEDPIEVYSRKYVQLQINEKQNLDYQEGIRQLLRHDPDIIVIGEIRDEMAAKMAVRSALTGHLVVSTIHAFSCESTINRMIELGVKQGQLKDVLVAVTNQRLYTQKNRKGKVGVYEIMQKMQLDEFFSQEPLQEFQTLQDELRLGIEKGILTKKATEFDLS